MNVFPMYMDIEDKTFLLVGGGSVAKWKVEVLRRFAARMVMVAEETDLEESEDLTIYRRRFQEEDLDMADFVIAATNDEASDREVVEACRRRGIPVNAVDRKELCDFFFPSIVKRGDLVLSISTSGASPAYAQRLRREVEELLPEHIEGILTRLGGLREEMAARIDGQKTRKAAYEEILERLIADEGMTTKEEIDAIMEKYEA